MTAATLLFKLIDHLYNHSRRYLFSLLIAFLIFGLWPFNFSEKNNAVVNPAGGLEIARHGTGYTAAPPEKLHDLNQFTIFIDLTTASNGLSSFERIFSYAINEKEMNFIVGQWKDGCGFHLPDEKRQRAIHFGADDLLNVDKQVRLLISYDGMKLSLYQDGNARKFRETGPLTLGTWSREYPLVVGTDADGKAQWKGRLFEIAMWDRALSPKAIRAVTSGKEGNRLQATGFGTKNGSREKEEGFGLPASGFGTKDGSREKEEGLGNRASGSGTQNEEYDKRPVIHYVFNQENTYETEFRGKKAIGVRDLGKGKAADLVIPEYFTPYKRAYLQWDEYWYEYRFNWIDVAVNILGFIPFGALLFLVLVDGKRRGFGIRDSGFGLGDQKIESRASGVGLQDDSGEGIDKKRLAYLVLLTVVMGFVVSFAIEYIQAYLPTRDSSLRDLITNVTGTLIGALVAAWLFAKSSWERGN